MKKFLIIIISFILLNSVFFNLSFTYAYNYIDNNEKTFLLSKAKLNRDVSIIKLSNAKSDKINKFWVNKLIKKVNSDIQKYKWFNGKKKIYSVMIKNNYSFYKYK